MVKETTDVLSMNLMKLIVKKMLCQDILILELE